jgi:hypothetical protein
MGSSRFRAGGPMTRADGPIITQPDQRHHGCPVHRGSIAMSGVFARRTNHHPPHHSRTRVPHLRDGFIAAKVGSRAKREPTNLTPGNEPMSV